MYSVVLGLEVLGNPVGFVRGLAEGTVGLFYHPFQGAVLGPEEFLKGLALGGHQFIGGTVGGVFGIGANITGAIGNMFAKLTFDERYQTQRSHTQSFGQGLDMFRKGLFEGVTGVVAKPVKGAQKEGIFGFIKGTGKGVLGLVFRPAGGLIDFTSATMLAVQKKTQVGDFELMQLRTLRYIAQDKIVHPYSLNMSTGYALFLAYNDGVLSTKDKFIGHVEIDKEPLKAVLVTDQRVMLLKRNNFLKKFENEFEVHLKKLTGKPSMKESTIYFTISSEYSIFGFGVGSKDQKTLKLPLPNAGSAQKSFDLILVGYNTI
jgi:vacuolar protein sorting-associated protein 13A/C